MQLEVTSFQETLNSGYCGPASLKMVLDYYGTQKTEQELAALTETNKDLGTTAKKIKEVAEQFGFQVEVKNKSEFSDLEDWLKKGVPLIVDWFTRGRDDYAPEHSVPDGHYSVVVGLDSEYIYLQDPEIGGIRKLEREVFRKVWFDFEGETIKSDELIIRQLIAIYR